MAFGAARRVTDKAVVLDASALVDLLVSDEKGPAVERRVSGCALHAPAHVDAEVLSALGRLHRAGLLSSRKAAAHLEALRDAPIDRHGLPELLTGAWRRQSRIRLADALYVELAHRLGAPLITTDERLARAAKIAEAVTAGEPHKGGQS